MRKELKDALVKDFPNVFRLATTPIEDAGWMPIQGFGIECGDGWEPIIRRLCEVIEKKDMVATQIKEKFGGLRFYVAGKGDGESDVAITEAEKESYKTCERCGEPGRIREGGWIQTLCDEHSK